MSWLVNNPVANLPGPQFLVFYAIFIAGVLFGCHWLLRQLDPSTALPPLPVPAKPDPYELAYLRGGVAEVARTVAFILLQRGYLVEAPSPGATATGPSSDVLARAPKAPDLRYLQPIEREAWDWFEHPASGAAMLRPGQLVSRLEPHCERYQQQLQTEQLLTPAQVRASAGALWLVGAALIMGLGAYKLAVALSRGRTNIDFLIVLAIVGVIALGFSLRIPRLSSRGQTYLQQLRVAFAQPRDRLAGTAFDGGDPLLPVLVGVFGLTALAGTPFDFYTQMVAPPRASSSSGGSCSSSSCSSGSSCGGGGCGGCGGGGGD